MSVVLQQRDSNPSGISPGPQTTTGGSPKGHICVLGLDSLSIHSVYFRYFKKFDSHLRYPIQILPLLLLEIQSNFWWKSFRWKSQPSSHNWVGKFQLFAGQHVSEGCRAQGLIPIKFSPLWLLLSASDRLSEAFLSLSVLFI